MSEDLVMLSNATQTYRLGGVEYTFRRLGVLRRAAIAEQVDASRRKARVLSLAEAISDEARRSAWIEAELAKPELPGVDPVGVYECAVRVAKESCVSPAGVTVADIDAAFEAADDSEVKSLMAFLFGKKNSKSQPTIGLKSSESSASGTGSPQTHPPA